MDITPEIVYNNYINAIPMLNDIFGNGNWYVSSCIDQAIIYSNYFNVKQPSCIDIKLTHEICVKFIDSPQFSIFLQTNPKLDKMKPIIIHIKIDEKPIVIKANICKYINDILNVSLNNINVRKINIIMSDIKRIMINYMDVKDINNLYYYTQLYMIYNEIHFNIKKKLSQIKDEKEQMMQMIATMDEMNKKNIFVSKNEYNEFIEKNCITEDTSLDAEPATKKVKE